MPWFLNRFKNLPLPIHRADAVRYIYLYVYGGFYADLDMECLKSHEALTGWDGAVFGLMGSNYASEDSVPNAWMGSVPGHPFWLHMLHKIDDTLSYTNFYLSPYRNFPEILTGPWMLYYALLDYHSIPDAPPVYYLTTEYIYPYDWYYIRTMGSICSAQYATFNATECKEKLDPEQKAFTITFWSHTWGDEAPNQVKFIDE